MTQNPKTDTKGIRGELGQKSGTGDEDDAQEWSHGRADRGDIAAGGSGARVDDVCRKVGISQATYYLWKRKYTGVGVSELCELRQLRDQVGQLRRVLAGCWTVLVERCLEAAALIVAARMAMKITADGRDICLLRLKCESYESSLRHFRKTFRTVTAQAKLCASHAILNASGKASVQAAVEAVMSHSCHS